MLESLVTDGGSVTNTSTVLLIEVCVAERCMGSFDELTSTPQFRMDAHHFEGKVRLPENHGVLPGDRGTFGRGGQLHHSGSKEVFARECAIHRPS